MFKNGMACLVKILERILMSLMLIMMLCSCKERRENTYMYGKTESGEYIYSGMVSNKETAKMIADNFFDNELHSNRDEYGSVEIEFKEEYQTWVVTYYYGDPDEYILGGDISIEISKKDGKIVSYCLGE